MRTPGVILLAAGLSGAAAMGLAALSAHGGGPAAAAAAGRLVETALLFHLLHALAMLALAAGVDRIGKRWAAVIAGCWIGGTVLFSGGLYLRVLTGAGTLGPVVPTGGLLYIAGWLLVAAAGLAVVVRRGRP